MLNLWQGGKKHLELLAIHNSRLLLQICFDQWPHAVSAVPTQSHHQTLLLDLLTDLMQLERPTQHAFHAIHLPSAMLWKTASTKSDLQELACSETKISKVFPPWLIGSSAPQRTTSSVPRPLLVPQRTVPFDLPADCRSFSQTYMAREKAPCHHQCNFMNAFMASKGACVFEKQLAAKLPTFSATTAILGRFPAAIDPSNLRL